MLKKDLVRHNGSLFSLFSHDLFFSQTTFFVPTRPFSHASRADNEKEERGLDVGHAAINEAAMQAEIALMVVIIFTMTKECIAPQGLLNTAHFPGGSSPVSLSSGSACAIAGVLVASTTAMAVNLLKRGNAARTLMTEAATVDPKVDPKVDPVAHQRDCPPRYETIVL